MGKRILILVIIFASLSANVQSGSPIYKHPWDSIEITEEFYEEVLMKYRIKRSQKISDFPLLDAEVSLINKMAKYALFLQVENDEAVLNQTLNRLFQSIPFFLLCDPEKWACLEQPPWQTTLPEYRQDRATDFSWVPLGEPKYAGENFEFELFFAPAIVSEEEKQAPMLTYVVREIEKSEREILINIFGIDDIDASMKPFFNAIKLKKEEGVDIKALVDQKNSLTGMLRTYDVVEDPGRKGFPKLIPLKKKLIPSYLPPEDRSYWVFGRPGWMDRYSHLTFNDWKMLKDEAKENGYELDGYMGGYVRALIDLEGATKDPNQVRMFFQYNGTHKLLELLNEGIKDEKKSNGRVEWLNSEKIEHNKIKVFDRKRVWTGTTNLSRTEMGEEVNLNVGILFSNKFVAKSYIEEFYEMFDFSGKMIHPKIRSPFNVGLAHTKKSANTPRYFWFDDGTEVRVHFSPTDDSEHRVLIPFLYSAKKGDHYRILMYGNSGLELIRGIQFAISRGADVSMILDDLSSYQESSWVVWDVANLCQRNPYKEPKSTLGSLSIYLDEWPGLLHVKGGTLTRNFYGKPRVTTLIIGSQNWSVGGNDDNDENMLTIRNEKIELVQLTRFNRYFEELKSVLESDGKVENPCKKSE